MGEVPSDEVKTHLEGCAACLEELERFRESVGSFNMASLAWSEEKSEGLPALRPTAKTKGAKADVGRSPRLIPALSVAVALVLLLVGVAVPVQRMHLSTLHDADVASVADDDPAGLNSPEQIAKDNELMADVNYELVHSRTVLLSQYDRQRGVREGAGMTETGKRSR